ncbi:MAG: cell division protein FtsA, partial [Epsilonproteobacteria bacterium]|nr:cell division protein FtsA [Campylobacterota bacterium]
VRLARPKEMDGLFDNLRSAEFSSAIGLIMYSANGYTPYEIDVNKRVRHTNEAPLSHSSVDFSSDKQEPSISNSENKETKMVSITAKKEKKSDEAGSISKFWNWATQLF